MTSSVVRFSILAVTGLALALWCSCGSKDAKNPVRPGPDASVDTEVVPERSDADPGRKDARAAADVSRADTAKPDTGICNHELDNPACWSTMEADSLTANTQSFAGAVFDGRYVTFLNSSNGPTLRYDTTAPFTERPSWSSINPGTYNIEGVAFDGRYLYLLPNGPYHNGAAGLTYDSRMFRYDTQKSPSISSSKEEFNVSKALNTADLMVPGARGAAFDGRYLYLAPSGNGQTSGVVVRYDTQTSFTEASSWSTFDATKVAANAKGFAGAVFDGKYVYFVPYCSMADLGTGEATPSGLALRFDSTSSFADTASWSTFDTTSLTPSAAKFFGASFDGRYLYFNPSNDKKGIIAAVRYDTQASFTASESWRSFDIRFVDPDWGSSSLYLAASTFDGRYVYFIPYSGGLLVRYDSQADFASKNAWTSLDLSRVGFYGGAMGAAFDGRYLYMAPTGFGSIARFDAKERGPLPPGHNAWFY